MALALPDTHANAGADMLSGLWPRLSHRLAMHVPVAPHRMRNNAPMLTIAFDDVPESALTQGAPILEAHGARGTFHIAGGLMGTRTPYWRLMGADGVSMLHARGHEIGCHTYGHEQVDARDGGRMADEILRNRACIARIDRSIRMENFAYPFGVGSWVCKRRFKRFFRSSRGIVPGLNRRMVDLQFLRALPLIVGRIDQAAIERILDDAAASRGWAIFYTHDVAARPSPFGCTPAMLEAVLRAAKQRGIRVRTVREALDEAGAPDAPKIA